MEKLQQTIESIKPLDENAMAKAKERQDQLTKPRGSLGVLESLSIKVAGIKGNPMPVIRDKAVIVVAGDHGVAEEGVSAYPQEVTAQMVYNFLAGNAGINVLARHEGIRITVVDAGIISEIPPDNNLVIEKIGHGTNNIAKGPAMTREQAILSLESGISLAIKEKEKGLDIIGAGDMGIANTTPSTAIASVCTKKKVSKIAGLGTGISKEQLKLKIKIIEKAIKINNPDSKDGIDILSKVGGFEIGTIAGIILGAASIQIPVVIDGFISTAGALIAATLCPQVKSYMIAAHSSVESGHNIMLRFLGLQPVLDLKMRLGEGTGSALAMGIIEAACKILCEMKTFKEAGVSDKE